MRLLLPCVLLLAFVSVVDAQALPAPSLTFDDQRTTYGPRELPPGEKATLATVLWRTCSSSAWILPASSVVARIEAPDGLDVEVPDLRFPEQRCLLTPRFELPANITIRNTGAAPADHLLTLTMHLPDAGPLHGRSNDIRFNLGLEALDADANAFPTGSAPAEEAKPERAAEALPAPAPAAIAPVLMLALLGLALARRR